MLDEVVRPLNGFDTVYDAIRWKIRPETAFRSEVNDRF